MRMAEINSKGIPIVDGWGMSGHTPGTEQMRCGLDCVGYNIIGKCWSGKYICASVTFTIISQGFINLALFYYL